MQRRRTHDSGGRNVTGRSRLAAPDRSSTIRLAGTVGLVSWALIGLAIVVTGIVVLLAAVSELVLPLLFAVMLGAAAYPLARRLQARGARPSLAAAAVVLGAVVAVAGVVIVVVDTVVDEVGAISSEVDDALDELEPTTDGIGLDEDALTDLRDAISSIAAVIGRGLVTLLVDGVGATVGFIGGAILGLLILYYVLKDGPLLRAWLVGQAPPHLREEAGEFVDGAVRSIRAYWAGRGVLSAAVTVVITAASALLGLPLLATIAVVNFVGGFIPYIGAVLGGGLAALLAASHGGLGSAVAILAVAVVANLLLENLLEPRIMSGRLSIHPLVVLMATTIGGVVGGIVGLILAVPATVVGIDLVSRIRRLLVAGAADPPTRG